MLLLLPGRQLLCLDDAVNLLKRLFALNFAQDISSLEKHGSILLELNRNGGELPSTYNFCHEIVHVDRQGLEHNWLVILVYCLKNHCLQLRPGRRLTRAGSRLRGRRAWTIAHAVLVLQLVHHHVVISRSSGLLLLLLLMLHILRVAAATLSCKTDCGSLLFSWNDLVRGSIFIPTAKYRRGIRNCLLESIGL